MVLYDEYIQISHKQHINRPNLSEIENYTEVNLMYTNLVLSRFISGIP